MIAYYKSLIEQTKGIECYAENNTRQFFLFDDFLIKKAKNRAGTIECINEYEIYNTIENKYKKYLCPILYFTDEIIITKKAKPIKLESYLKDLENVIYYLCREYHLNYIDLLSDYNWGLLNKSPVLINYGETFFKGEVTNLL